MNEGTTQVTVTESRRGGRWPDRGRFVIFRDATIEDVDFSGMQFHQFASHGSRFIACDFSQSYLGGGALSGRDQTVFRECTFDDASVDEVSFGTARFERCSFERVRFVDQLLLAAEFVECVFSGVIRQTVFSGSPRIWTTTTNRLRNEFRDNDFSRADIRDIRLLGGFDCSVQLWPESIVVVVDAQRRISVARQRLQAETGPDAVACLRELEVYARVVDNEQDCVVIRRDEIPAGIRDHFWTTLLGA